MTTRLNTFWNIEKIQWALDHITSEPTQGENLGNNVYRLFTRDFTFEVSLAVDYSSGKGVLHSLHIGQIYLYEGTRWVATITRNGLSVTGGIDFRALEALSGRLCFIEDILASKYGA